MVDWSKLATVGANALGDIGYGLTQGTNLQQSLQAAGQRTAQMAQPRAQAEVLAQQEQQRQADIARQQEMVTRYAQELSKDPANQDLVRDLQIGVIQPADAWAEALKRSQGTKPSYQTLSPGESVVEMGPQGPRPVYTAPTQPKLGDGMMAGPNGTAVPVPGGKEAFDRESALWKEYQAQEPVKAYQIVKGQYERIRQSAQLANGVGDVSMIFAYMKMLDPTSVVREGEFATAQNTGGIPDRVANLYNQVLKGERLPDNLRTEFVKAADAIYQDVASNLNSANSMFEPRATGAGVDPSRILITAEQFQSSVNSGTPTPVPGLNGVTIRRLN